MSVSSSLCFNPRVSKSILSLHLSGQEMNFLLCSDFIRLGMKVMTVSVCGSCTGTVRTELLAFILVKEGAHLSGLSSLLAQEGAGQG